MLLDTSGLYCYLDARDSRNAEAVKLLNSATIRITHNYVLAELVALCNVRGFDRRVTLGFIEQLAADPTVMVSWIGPIEHAAAIDLLRNRIDKSYSLCDAVSFLLMKRQRVTEALTTDRHFEQEGFVRLLDA